MKTEIIAKIEALLINEQVHQLNDEFKTLSDQFYQIIKEENHQFDIKKLERIEAGEEAEDIQKSADPLDEQFRTLNQTFKARSKAEFEQQKAEESVNLNTKKELIVELKTLIDTEKNIGKAIQIIKDIQEKWRSTGSIPRNKRQEIQKEYSNLMDDFQYNINIYKEIKDHDLVKNGRLKNTLVEQLKTLLQEDNIKTLETKLHQIQNEWNEIGGTSAEEWEKLKTDYWETVNELYKKVRLFYDGRREEQKENIVKKLALIDKVDEVLELDCETQSEWQKSTNKIIAIQNEWKTIGFGPKKENEIVWRGFRAKCDIFFNAKKEFFKDINSEFDKVKNQKLLLIEKVKAIKDSTDWNETTKFIVNIQKDWKKLGSAGQRHENKLWKNFRDPIDTFFDRKDAHYEALDKNNAGNLALKEALIEEIKAYKIKKDPKAALNDLKAFSKSFSGIGHVPYKSRDIVYNAYQKVLDEKYEAINLDKNEKDAILYQVKVEGIYNSPNMDREVEKENFAIRKMIDEKTKEKNQVETNLSFFANSDQNNPLLKSVKDRITTIEGDIQGLKAKLSLLNNFDQESE